MEAPTLVMDRHWTSLLEGPGMQLSFKDQRPVLICPKKALQSPSKCHQYATFFSRGCCPLHSHAVYWTIILKVPNTPGNAFELVLPFRHLESGLCRNQHNMIMALTIMLHICYIIIGGYWPFVISHQSDKTAIREGRQFRGLPQPPPAPRAHLVHDTPEPTLWLCSGSTQRLRLRGRSRAARCWGRFDRYKRVTITC